MSISGYCSLIIAGDNLDLDFIEETLGLTASEKRRKGEVFNSITGEAQSDFIQFSEKTNEKYNPDEILITLLNKLVNKKEFLKELSKKACVYMRCYVQSDYAQIYYTLSAETMNKIAQLDIDLGISIFSWGGVKDDRKKRKRKKKKEKEERKKKKVSK